MNRSQLEQWAREEEERRQAEADELERLRQSNERARQEWLAHLKVQEVPSALRLRPSSSWSCNRSKCVSAGSSWSITNHD